MMSSQILGIVGTGLVIVGASVEGHEARPSQGLRTQRGPVCAIEQTPQERSVTISCCCGTPVRLPRDGVRRHPRFPNIRCAT